MVSADRGAEPARSGVDEQPDRAVRVAIELDEVISSPERAEVAMQEPLPLVRELARRERGLEERPRRGSAAANAYATRTSRRSSSRMPGGF